MSVTVQFGEDQFSDLSVQQIVQFSERSVKRTVFGSANGSVMRIWIYFLDANVSVQRIYRIVQFSERSVKRIVFGSANGQFGES